MIKKTSNALSKKIVCNKVMYTLVYIIVKGKHYLIVPYSIYGSE